MVNEVGSFSSSSFTSVFSSSVVVLFLLLRLSKKSSRLQDVAKSVSATERNSVVDLKILFICLCLKVYKSVFGNTAYKIPGLAKG